MKEKAKKVSSVEQAVKEAAKAKSKDDEMLYAGRVIGLASQVLQKKLNDEVRKNGEWPDKVETLQFEIHGNTLAFGLQKENEARGMAGYNLYGKINGKIYSGEELKEQINRIDGIGLTDKEKERFEAKQKREEAIEQFKKKDLPVYKRTLAISAVRHMQAETDRSIQAGDSILGKLMAMLGRAVTQNR